MQLLQAPSIALVPWLLMVMFQSSKANREEPRILRRRQQVFLSLSSASTSSSSQHQTQQHATGDSSARLLVVHPSDSPSLSPSSILLTLPASSDVPSVIPSKTSMSSITPTTISFPNSLLPTTITAATATTVPTVLGTTVPTVMATPTPTMIQSVVPTASLTTSTPSVSHNFPTSHPVFATPLPTPSSSSFWPTISPTLLVLSTPLPTPSISRSSFTLPPSIVASDIPSSSPSISRSILPTTLRTSSLRPSNLVPTRSSLAPILSSPPGTSKTSQPSKAYPSANPSSESTNPPVAFVGLTPSKVLSSAPSRVYMVPSSSVVSGSAKSDQPSRAPSYFPSIQRSDAPSSAPSRAPSDQPSATPTSAPSSSKPSFVVFTQSVRPSDTLSTTPSLSPSFKRIVSVPSPSDVPSISPSGAPSSIANAQTAPSDTPSTGPSMQPSPVIIMTVSALPSALPSELPASAPSKSPSQHPSSAPTSIEKAYATESVYSFPSLSSEMNDTNKKVFEQVAQSFLSMYINMVPGIHIAITSFAVTGQSVVNSSRRQLLSTGGLLVDYNVGAMVSPPDPTNFNFGYMVLNTFATYNAEFLQQLSEASTFFPSSQQPSYSVATSNTYRTELSRNTTIYVTVSGVALCMAVFIGLGLWLRRQRRGRRTVVSQDVPQVRALGTTGSIVLADSSAPEASILESPVSQYMGSSAVEVLAMAGKLDPELGTTESLAPI